MDNGVLAGLPGKEAWVKYPLLANGRPVTEAIEEAIYEMLETYKTSKGI